MDDYEKLVAQAMLDNPGWRYGQTLFNVLYSHFPRETNEIRGTELDPFYRANNDPKMAMFWTWYYNTFY